MGFLGLAGNTQNHYSLSSESILRKWVVDMGATSHMCYDLNQFIYFSKPNQRMTVNLPDESSQPIIHVGRVILNPKITLYNIMHVLSFKQNLLSINKLTQNTKISVQFLSNQCLLQDLMSSIAMLVARVQHGL